MSQILGQIKALKHARSLLEAGWIKGEYIQDEFGNGVSLSMDTKPGYCYCATGALYVGTKLENVEWFECELLLEETLRLMGGTVWDIVAFNDNDFTKKEDVLEVFDATIRRLEASLQPS